jgi:putative oxidoreductase
MNTNKITQFTLFLLRVVAGLLFMQEGGMKLFQWFGGMPPSHAAPPVMSQMWIGGWIEVVGGALVLVGLFTRVAAFILSGEMAVAYFQFHFPKGIWPAQNDGTPAVLFCFIFLMFAAVGAGAISLDALLASRKSHTRSIPRGAPYPSH